MRKHSNQWLIAPKYSGRWCRRRTQSTCYWCICVHPTKRRATKRLPTKRLVYLLCALYPKFSSLRIHRWLITHYRRIYFRCCANWNTSLKVLMRCSQRFATVSEE